MVKNAIINEEKSLLTELLEKASKKEKGDVLVERTEYKSC
jgi:hypothetical protein